MDIVRAAAGVSDSGEEVSVSLAASAGTDDESCAGGWGTMIDNDRHQRSNVYHC